LRAEKKRLQKSGEWYKTGTIPTEITNPVVNLPILKSDIAGVQNELTGLQQQYSTSILILSNCVCRPRPSASNFDYDSTCVSHRIIL
jgi:hypothetical protein